MLHNEICNIIADYKISMYNEIISNNKYSKQLFLQQFENLCYKFNIKFVYLCICNYNYVYTIYYRNILIGKLIINVYIIHDIEYINSSYLQ